MSMAMSAWSLGFQFSAATDNCSVPLLKASSGFVATKPCHFLHKRRLLSSGTTIVPRAAAPVTDVQSGNQGETDTVPTPVVIIDQDTDPNATVVEITFGDRLGALLDTESSSQLAMGAAFGLLPPKEQTSSVKLKDKGPRKQGPKEARIWKFLVDVDIATHINISADGPDRSLFYVETADRPGLLVDLVKSITDIDIAVESGEFDTEGLLAKAKFHVSYKGKAISKPLQQVLNNSLRYFLRRPTTEESSF
ncbi:hypothetical protein TSUD_259940 [Trifolium subterraneum]|uniref:ACT domain-containing protein ACR n=1 Tax=Trifolium subterraneum TaxID=3900 RepID=A0A2Z6MPS5_TRISU|nr:hypothetical protein TSUD_259940 [Trifolium subterraneum]